MSNPIDVRADCRPGSTIPARTPLAISARHPYIGAMHSLLRFPCLRALTLLLFTNSLGAQTPAPSPRSTQPIALKAARLFDGKSKTLVPNGVVVIEGNTITAAGSNATHPGQCPDHRSRRRHPFARIHGRAHAPDLRLFRQLQRAAPPHAGRKHLPARARNDPQRQSHGRSRLHQCARCRERFPKFA